MSAPYDQRDPRGHGLLFHLRPREVRVDGVGQESFGQDIELVKIHLNRPSFVPHSHKELHSEDMQLKEAYAEGVELEFQLASVRKQVFEVKDDSQVVDDGARGAENVCTGCGERAQSSETGQLQAGALAIYLSPGVDSVQQLCLSNYLGRSGCGVLEKEGRQEVELKRDELREKVRGRGQFDQVLVENNASVLSLKY